MTQKKELECTKKMTEFEKSKKERTLVHERHLKPRTLEILINKNGIKYDLEYNGFYLLTTIKMK